MGKYEKGTPKEIANRCKSKGLQKLRWFCQMCQKQCRDQNGFKCHLTSEAHQRVIQFYKMLIFFNNVLILTFILSLFIKHFVLRSTFGTKRVLANEVYQEYIRDKMHVHMNSTVWHTLTNFVQYLGSSGKCKIDQTEKGWFIALIDQEEEMRKREAAMRVKVDHDDEQRLQEMLKRQAERARELLSEKDEHKSQATELLRDFDGEKVTFSLGPKKPLPKVNKLLISIYCLLYLKGNDGIHDKKGTEKQIKKRALEEIMELEIEKKKRKMRKDYWLSEGIIVKVIVTKKFGNEFYKVKGVVKNLVDKYTANIDVNGNAVGQEYLETVIPCEGRKMLIVNGLYCGKTGTLKSINEEEFSLKLIIDNGPEKGRLVSVPYEDASKLAT
uniref:Kin17_mid domain-containing protein n=1 Tax=Syphacia muris TaxID=451379 RepID=A0A0N5ARA0_9BILA